MYMRMCTVFVYADSRLSQWLGFVNACGFCVCELTATRAQQRKESVVTAEKSPV